MTSIAQKQRDVNKDRLDSGAEGRFEVRDQRKSQWFWLDNELVDRAGPVIGPTAGAVYSSLARHAANSSQSCYPSLKTLGREWGLSHPTVIKAVKTLEKYRMIQVERHPQAARLHLANVYTLTPPSTWELPEAGKRAKPAQKRDQDRETEGASKGDLPGLVNDVYQASKPGLHEPDPSNHPHNNQHHDAAGAADADGDGNVGTEGPNGNGSSLKNEGLEGNESGGDQGRRRFLEELLGTLGDDHPGQVIDRALDGGWTLENLAEDVQRLADLNGGKIRNKAAWLRSMLPKGSAALNVALDRYGASGGDEAKRLRAQLEGLLAEWHSAGTEKERRTVITQEGRAVKTRLSELGENPDRIISAWRAKWLSAEEDEYRGPEEIKQIAEKFQERRL